VLAWLCLVLLTLASFGAHLLPLGGFATPVALLIAVVKATIVALVFMHLLEEAFSIRCIAVLNAVWVALLCLGIVADVGWR
jgi:cytochrome c oxidase subunit IV